MDNFNYFSLAEQLESLHVSLDMKILNCIQSVITLWGLFSNLIFALVTQMLGRNHLNHTTLDLNVCDLQLHPITIKHFLTHLWKIKPEEMRILIINKRSLQWQASEKINKLFTNLQSCHKGRFVGSHYPGIERIPISK